MRLMWLLLSVAMVPPVLGTEPEMRLKHSGTLEGACPNAGSPIVFSPDGQLLAFVGSRKDDPGHSVMVWDLAKRKAVLTFDGAEQYLGSPAFSPDGKTLAAACNGDLVKLWDMATKKERSSLKGGKGPLAFSPDGKTLASGCTKADGNERGLKLWDIATRTDKGFLPAENKSGVGLLIYCVAFSADGKCIATGTGGRAPDGQHRGGTVKLWDVTARKEKAVLLDGALLTSVAFSPNSKHLASADQFGNVVLWDVGSGKRTPTLQTFNPRKVEETANPTYSVAFSPDGKTLAVGTVKGLKLWHMQDDRKAVAVDGPGASVWSVAFSPDGKTLATSGSKEGASRPDFETESTVRLWQCPPAERANK